MSAHAVRLRLVISLSVLIGARCVCLTSSSLGDECDDSSSCSDELVCVLLDESVSNGPAVCVPMKSVDEPQPCAEARDCAAAAWPVDATCVDGECACVGDTFVFTCSPGELLASATCTCIIVPADFDAGPSDDDAGPSDDDAGPGDDADAGPGDDADAGAGG